MKWLNVFFLSKSYHKNKYKKYALPNKAMKGGGLISYDAQISWKNSLESVYFMKADSQVGFYEMLILCFV